MKNKKLIFSNKVCMIRVLNELNFDTKYEP